MQTAVEDLQHSSTLDFELNENQQQIAEMIRKFGADKIAPYIREWDDQQTFPLDVMHQLGQQGLLGVLVPEAYGGTGFGYLEYITAIAELAKFDPGIALSMAAHNSLCTNHILQFGNEDQKQRYLPKLASGEWIGAWGLTEPNTGSDASNMKTTAEWDGEAWVLNGMKNFISHGISGNVAVIVARTGEPRVSGNATAFILDMDAPGFSPGKKEDKLGMRTSETAQMLFDNVRLSDAQRLGEVGDGFRQAMKILDGGRISIAALSVGIARGAYEACMRYVNEREQFGQKIGEFQAIGFKLADMYTEIQAAELLTFRAGAEKNAGKTVTKSSAMAKWYASEVCVQVSVDAVQVFGGYGYVKDYPVEKFYRDSKLCTIGEGTSEIQQLVISRQLLKES